MNSQALVEQLAESSRVLASPTRITMLSILRERKALTWSELKSILESRSGPINPNTMHFHLKVLLTAEVIRRAGSETAPIYEIQNVPGPMEDMLRRLDPAQRSSIVRN